MSRDDVLIQLKKEIERTDAQTELECGKLLKNIAWVLLTIADGNTTYVRTEQICSTGRVDIVVLANSLQPGGNFRREAHIWELKAPQVPLFDLKTQSQAQPSVHLYSAETQLMHYCYAVSNDAVLLRRWGILSPDHIRLGGIIIGRDINFVACNEEDKTLAKQLACEAHEIREVFFYRKLNLKLWTWDKVITLAESQSLSHHKFQGDPKISIDLHESVDLSATIIADP
ncbi:MAG: hypothetical protein GX654_00620 [Desulfatiglans sp.]|nr:hypothetical protein [Desulfatiglans sp.]